jgi:hypothetical protein
LFCGRAYSGEIILSFGCDSNRIPVLAERTYRSPSNLSFARAPLTYFSKVKSETEEERGVEEDEKEEKHV